MRIVHFKRYVVLQSVAFGSQTGWMGRTNWSGWERFGECAHWTDVLLTLLWEVAYHALPCSNGKFASTIGLD